MSKKVKGNRKNRIINVLLIILGLILTAIIFKNVWCLIAKKLTFDELYSPIIAKDVAGLKLIEQRVEAPYRFIKYSPGKVFSQYQRRNDQSPDQVFADLKNIAEADGWVKEFDKRQDNYLYANYNKKGREIDLTVYLNKKKIIIDIEGVEK